MSRRFSSRLRSAASTESNLLQDDQGRFPGVSLRACTSRRKVRQVCHRHVSSSLHFERSMRISRTPLPGVLRDSNCREPAPAELPDVIRPDHRGVRSRDRNEAICSKGSSRSDPSGCMYRAATQCCTSMSLARSSCDCYTGGVGMSVSRRPTKSTGSSRCWATAWVSRPPEEQPSSRYGPCGRTARMSSTMLATSAFIEAGNTSGHGKA